MKKITFTSVLSVAFLLAVVILLGFFASRIPAVWLLAGLGVAFVCVLIARRPWYGFLLFVFFIPFERIGSYDIAGVTIRPSQVIILLTMIFVGAQQLRARRMDIPSLPLLAPIAVFVASSFLGLTVAPNAQRSFFVLLFILFTIIIALFIPLMVRTTRDVRALLHFLFISCAVVSLFGLFQFVGDVVGLPTSVTGLRDLYTKDVLGFPRVQSTALEPLYFANYLLIPIGVLLSLFVQRNALMRRWPLVVLLGLALMNFVLTVARGGYIAFAALVLVIAVFHFCHLFQLRLLSYITVAGLLAVFFMTQFLNAQDVADRANNFMQHVGNLFVGASYVERVETFTTATRAWREHPWIGLGPGSFGPYESVHPTVVPPDGWQIVNNEYLELLAEHGVIGFTAMASLFLLVIMRSVKAIRRTQDAYCKAITVGFLAAFVGILVQWNTFSTLYVVHIWFTIGMLVALQNIVLRQIHDSSS